MAYVVPIHRSSSIRHALRIKLFSADEECLAIAKSNRVEIWRFTEHDELVLAHSQRVYGTISMLQALRPKDVTTELLFVGTDRFDFFTLAWDHALQSLQTVDHFYDIGEKHLRDSQSQDRCIVDPSGRYMSLLLWEGVLCVLRMKNRPKNTSRNTVAADSLDWMDQVRLSEMFIKASTFLHSETGHPKVAFLYQSQSDRSETRLSSYRLTSDDANSVASRFDTHRDRELNEDLKDIGSALLIPVEADGSERRHNFRGNSNNNNSAGSGDGEPHLGGLLIVGETRLIYYDGITHNRIEKATSTPAIYVAWAQFDRTHYFVADDQGTLRLLTLITRGPVVTRLDIRPIGKTARASTLVYYPSRSMLFVGSHAGDSQLYRISLSGEAPPSATEGSDDKKASSFCQLVQTFTNVGPIFDFSVVDMGSLDSENGVANEYSSGQARIVTGSGVYRDASLRSIRSGVGLEDAGILGDFSNVRSLYSLRLNPATTPPNKVDTLVVSFLTETRVFTFDGEGDIEEKDSLLGGSLEHQSLWASNITRGSQNLVLRVTSDAATLVDTDGGVTVATWSPPEGKSIISVSANDNWVLLSVDGTLLVSLSLDKDLAVAAQNDFSGTDQIACIHAAPKHQDTGVVSMWTAGTVTVVSLSTLQPAGNSVPFRSKNDSTSVARSIALVQVMPPHLAGPTLFVALDEGTVVMFSYNEKDSTLSAPKSTILGVHHANLHLLPSHDESTKGMYSILATANHPSLIYGSEGRIICAAVTAQDTTSVCPFDSEAFPGAVVLASQTEIKLANVDTMRRTHVQTIPIGETIRRVAYAQGERVFALACIGLEVIRGVEIAKCAIKLVDDVLFQPVGKPLLLTGDKEEFLESLICTELPDAQGTMSERFLVGTSFNSNADSAQGGGVASSYGNDPDDTSTMGRLLVVGIDSERNPYIVSAHRLRGPCRSLAVLADGDSKKIVLGLTRTVIVAEYTEMPLGTQSRLRKVASTRASTMVIDLAVNGRYIAIGDMMKSTAVVEYVPAVEAAGSDDEEEEDDATKVREKDKKYRYMKLDGDKKSKKQEAKPAQLVQVARNYQANWTTAVAALGGPSKTGDAAEDKMATDDTESGETISDKDFLSWLEADAYGNLSVLSYNSQGVTAEDRRRLRVTSEMNLGEMVNRIRRVDVEPTNAETAMVHPQAFLATTEGAVYLFGTVAPAALDLLLRLQARLETVVKGLGTTSFSSYRGFRNTERETSEPSRFLDGEMLERFLDLDEEQQQDVAQGLGPSVEDVRGRIEELRRMH
ncbi:uv-damaged dna-binding protein [Ophiostoma piceae UAMH 11346]|uniref:Uv-damaged dna-binding protein n=1 Tax=Ophiostoma piceae (strain UAMH 11346) TaxID=1262450 RepID=S3CIV0_OPHP1|nr:uv-damaged dna-binding protein [Ophiostoma piceae UAMH 11346]